MHKNKFLSMVVQADISALWRQRRVTDALYPTSLAKLVNFKENQGNPVLKIKIKITWELTRWFSLMT